MDPIRSSPFGFSRSCIRRNYALITPDTHVISPLVGWKNASAVIHISPEMGARFTQYTAILEPGAISASPGASIERFVYILDGAVTLAINDQERMLSPGAYAYLPAGIEHRVTTAVGDRSISRLLVFEKPYRAMELAGQPSPRIGRESDVPGEPFKGDSALRLQVLLPAEPTHDIAVNIFTYQPGGTLPQVEIHVMEHGLLMLEGAGVYRLGEDYYPVQTGDIIWMASYCPQWFVATGKQPAKYLYYKDVHRDRLYEK